MLTDAPAIRFLSLMSPKPVSRTWSDASAGTEADIHGAMAESLYRGHVITNPTAVPTHAKVVNSAVETCLDNMVPA